MAVCALQMLFTCVSMVLSLTIFAYILGEISNLVMDQDAELVKTRTQVCLLCIADSITHTKRCLHRCCCNITVTGTCMYMPCSKQNHMLKWHAWASDASNYSYKDASMH